MSKILAGVLLGAGVLGSVIIPGPAAHAGSPVCSKAIELINTAIDSPAGLDADTTAALADRLSGLLAVAGGAERDSISAYVDALRDPEITDLAAVTDELNRACA
ncbi:hypothetical protein [Nocardia sp. NPDC056100]|uniref:hypothetical protein n=1 Tax=Nocardia sp. NPDC056100 TaxID=3345712 RepID=UPI0035E17DF6